MSGADTAWVGDLVYDEDTGRRGIVTDVRGGSMWVLRPEFGTGRWTSRAPERLTVLIPRERMSQES
ncbi:hypothetical protein ACPCIU_00650 [Streptomyces seoulensis]|uniref:hypothetical protein n=1 Tax=Streptomyces seoulensis TaxID=73044 RepID=UPI003C2EF1ED